MPLYQASLDPVHFAEGVARTAAGTLLVLTWREGVVHELDPLTLGPVPGRAFQLPKPIAQGWGAATQRAAPDTVYVTDGSAQLHTVAFSRAAGGTSKGKGRGKARATRFRAKGIGFNGKQEKKKTYIPKLTKKKKKKKAGSRVP
jgi:hypothetical protein